MAILDFKQYLYKVQQQYLEMKTDLNDFNQALEDGFITEEQLQAAMEDVAAVENNYHRLLYVAWLLEIPRRKQKKAKYKIQNADVIDAFNSLNASSECVLDENTSLLTHFKQELKRLRKQNKEKE